MAQTYTLDEAAHKLGISPEEYKRKLKGEWKTLKSFRDGPTLRFRSADIDELARTLGQASDPGLQPGDGGLLAGDSSDEIGLEVAAPPSGKSKKSAVEKPPSLDDSDDSILTLASGDSGVSKKKPKKSGDSDVRLDRTPPKKDPGAKELTEEISLDLSGPRSGILKSPSSRKLSGLKPKGSDSAKIPGPKDQPASDDSSSEFELSLDSDSDSFELQLNTDSSEEVALGGAVPTGAHGDQSGINLRKPADSGVSLEKNKGVDSDSDVDFELSLDAPGAPSGRLGTPKSAGKADKDSDSEFELSLDDNSGVTDGIADDLDGNKGDIFETDFELPVVADEESGSEVVAIDSADTDLENSDFDIAIGDDDIVADDDSASQVMLVDDEAVLVEEDDAQPRTGKKRRDTRAGMEDDVLLDDLETEGGSSASSAMRRARHDDDDAPVRTVVAKPATWGPLPAILLLPCLIIVLLGGLMSFEVLRGMWGYQQPVKTSDSLVRGVAGTLGMKASE